MPGVAEEIARGAVLATLTPLRIRALQEVKSSTELTTYKPSYAFDTAKNALDTSGMFEGPISLFALDPEPVQSKKEKIITGEPAITWKLLADLMNVFDVVEACNSKMKGPTAEEEQVKRTMWPVTLTCALDDEDALRKDRKPLLFGHQYLFAWYLSMYKQLDQHPKVIFFAFFSAP